MSTEGAVEVAEADGRDFVTEEDVQAAEAPATPERPEWLPEKFNNPEDLAKSYNELSQKLGTKEEDIRNSIIEEMQNEAFSDRPETSGDYTMPDFIDEESAVDNDLLKWWADHSFENGFSQTEFEKGIEMYANAISADIPDYDEEFAALGDNANDRIDAASAWANKFFPESALPAIERMCETHEGIIALETIMESMKDGNFSGDMQANAGLNEQKLREMMNDPKYWNPSDRDPHFIKQVEDGFKQLYRG